MTAINPSISVSATRHGQAMHDCLDRVARPAPVESHRVAAGPFAAGFQCLISLGLYPLLTWPGKWSEFLEIERHDLLDLVAWWRDRAPADSAITLDKIARQLRPRPMLMILPWLAVGFNAVLIATLLTQGDSFSRIWDLAMQHAWPSRHLSWTHDHWERAVPLEQHLYPVWMITLCLAYFCQWYAVRSHAVVVCSLVRFTNQLARTNRFTKVKNDVLKVGLNPLWIILGILLCAQHAWWAIPMVFAGALQRTYSTRSSPKIRVALANQARDAAALFQVKADRFCRTAQCGARLPMAAKFCPRCGSIV